MFQILPSSPDDAAEVEALLDAAFGPQRLTKTSYRYRDGIPPVEGLSYVARSGGRIVGSIAFWPVAIGERAGPALLLGPLAVDPARRQQGIGGALVAHTLALAAGRGHRLVVLVGEPAYYRKFGFVPASPAGLAMPGERGERLQARELAPGALAAARGEIRRWEPDAAARRAARPSYLSRET